MNKKEFEDRWSLIRSRSKIWWSLITDLDLESVDKAEVKFYEYVNILQSKYAISRQVAKNEIVRHLKEYEVKVETVDPR